MRKDVECTFGILKGRWRILKTGIRLHATESVDKIWLTCCAFHNMLLEVDGLDEPWDGVKVPKSVWIDGEFSELEEEEVPMALQRILPPKEIRQYDISSLGAYEGGADNEDNDEEPSVVGTEDGGAQNVRDLSRILSRKVIGNSINR